MPERPELQGVLTALRVEYPDARPPKFRGPFEIVLYENVAYLVPDDRRQAVWRDFCDRIGSTPDDVVATDPDLLAEVLQPGGMHSARRAEKIRTCSSIVLDEFDGDLAAVLDRPDKERRKALKQFPGFGDPGVDKILMLTKRTKVLALESNGMRVLLRLGFGKEAKNYSTSYKSVQTALADELPKRADSLILAHHLLRTHGQTVCKNNRPLCDECCLQDVCPSSSV